MLLRCSSVASRPLSSPGHTHLPPSRSSGPGAPQAALRERLVRAAERPSWHRLRRRCSLASNLMSDEVLKVGLIQMAMTASRQHNVSHALAAVAEAADRGARLVCLPELFATPYFCQTEDPEAFELAEPIPGPTTERLAQLARRRELVVVAPVFERRAPGVYHNSVAILGPSGELLGMYRKMHIPDDPHFQEKFYFTPGDLGFVAVQTPVATLGPLICWDQWFAEAARLSVLRGAQLLVYPTAIGWLSDEKADSGAGQLAAWRTIQQGHAIGNGVFVLSVNRVGFEPASTGGIEFWGHSFVCDPFGQLLGEAGEQPEVLVVDCELGRIEHTRRAWPFLRDRRVDAYRGLSARLLDGDER
jgi:N-carbamoylputrescine amidase